MRPCSCVTGARGRLGSAIVSAMMARGDNVGQETDALNYLVFAHRYRGEPDYGAEMKANLTDVIEQINNTQWALGDKAIVLISSIAAEDPNPRQSLAYNISKAGLNQLARYYAKTEPVRINTVSPATFTGEARVVSIGEVVDVILFLCSPASTGINGQDIRVTGRYLCN